MCIKVYFENISEKKISHKNNRDYSKLQTAKSN